MKNTLYGDTQTEYETYTVEDEVDYAGDENDEPEYVDLKTLVIDGNTYTAFARVNEEDKYFIAEVIEEDGEEHLSSIDDIEQYRQIAEIFEDEFNSKSAAESLKPLDSYKKDGLLEILKSAATLLKKAEKMIRDMDNAKSQIAHYSKSPAKSIILGIICAIIGANSLGSSIFWTVVPFLAIVGLIAKRVYMKSQRGVWQEEYDRLDYNMSSYFKNTLYNSPEVKLIPSDYRHSIILENMVSYIRNMEASLWKECVALWKTDVHRATLEDEAEETRELARQAAESSKNAERSANIAVWNTFWS